MIVILSLITTGIRSAFIASSRVSMVSAMDLGLYSLFGQFDRDLIEHFGLLFIDGGRGQEKLQMGKIYQELEDTVGYNLFTESMSSEFKVDIKAGSIRGYTLATDGRGRIFKEQVISYMQETLGAQGVQQLMNKTVADSETIKKQEADKEKIDSGDMADYEEVKRVGEEALAEALAEGTADAESQVSAPPGFINPIEIIKMMKDLGTLTLLVPEGEHASKKVLDLESCVSRRGLQQGMGIIPSSNESQGIIGDFLFQEYLLKNCGSYVSPSGSASLEYQLEYLLQGKARDIENLTGVANQLLLTREAANVIHLLTDSSKRAQVASMSATISMMIGMPQAQKLVEGILILCWAFGESVIDVRALFRGEKVALVKDSTTWQLSLENLSRLPELLNGELGGNENGLDYQGYLRALLLLKNEDEKVMRAMDIVEMTISSISGREGFRMDSCLASLEVEMQMNVSRNSYDVRRSYSYEM